MKTLTLFRAYAGAWDEWFYYQKKMSLYRQDELDALADRRRRQVDKFHKALTKRLQEQEEELDRLRAYENDTRIFLGAHGFSFAEWAKGYEDYLKEKTNELLVVGNSV